MTTFNITDYKYLVPFLLFIATVFVTKPWKSRIDSKMLLLLIFIDALAFRSSFFLNFYKIIVLARIPLTFKDLKDQFSEKKTKAIVVFGVLFILVPIINGLAVLYLGDPSLFDASLSSTREHLFSILKNALNMLTVLLLGWEIYKNLKEEGFNSFFSGFTLLSCILIIGIFIEKYTKFDLYYHLTGGRPLPLSAYIYERVRGFAFEPRGAVILSAICLGATFLFNKKSFFILAPLIVLCSLLSISASGAVCMLAVLIFCLIYSLAHKDLLGVGKVFYVLISFVLIFNFYPSLKENMTMHLRDRSFIVETGAKQDLLSRAINKLEANDAAYVNFVKNNPEYLIVGVGILSPLVTKKWYLEKDKNLFPLYAGNPFVGAIFLLSMYGFISIFVLISVLYMLDRNKMQTAGQVMFSILITLAGIQYFYTLPFVVVACFYLLERLSEGKEAKLV